MKKIFLLFIVLPLLTIGQKLETKFVLDSLGNKSDYYTLRAKNPDKTFEFRIAKDTGMVHQMSLPKFETFEADYKFLKNEIEKITSQKYSDSTVFLIDFNFFNDNGRSNMSNNFDKDLYNDRKFYFNSLKKQVEKNHKNLVFIVLFQHGIKLYNNVKIKPEKEYFFNDNTNFFKKNLFLNSALCGSKCLIDCKGNILLKNGEFTIVEMANHLKPEIWNKIFSTTNVNEKTEDKE